MLLNVLLSISLRNFPFSRSAYLELKLMNNLFFVVKLYGYNISPRWAYFVNSLIGINSSIFFGPTGSPAAELLNGHKLKVQGEGR